MVNRITTCDVRETICCTIVMICLAWPIGMTISGAIIMVMKLDNDYCDYLCGFVFVLIGGLFVVVFWAAVLIISIEHSCKQKEEAEKKIANIPV